MNSCKNASQQYTQAAVVKERIAELMSAGLLPKEAREAELGRCRVELQNAVDIKK